MDKKLVGKGQDYESLVRHLDRDIVEAVVEVRTQASLERYYHSTATSNALRQKRKRQVSSTSTWPVGTGGQIEADQAAEKGPSAALACSRAPCGVPRVHLSRRLARRLASGPF